MTNLVSSNDKLDNESVEFLTTKDVAEALCCSLPTARKIMQRYDFPLIKAGRNMRVLKSAFIKWAESRHI